MKLIHTQFERSSGVLLHLTSLPGKFGSGDLGPSSYHFVDWLALAGQKLWQVLPFHPEGLANSPYAGLSAFAGSPMFVDLQELHHKGWLTHADIEEVPPFTAHRVRYEEVRKFRFKRLYKAFRSFAERPDSQDKQSFEEFCHEEASWLHDYALFAALNEKHGHVEWGKWEESIRHRKQRSIQKAEHEYATGIAFHKFVQWNFHTQWLRLKAYANGRGIRIVGDIPIFVAYHSSDVWAQQHLFHLDKNSYPTFVAGVPPDYFSKTGQRWGNPLYRWEFMEKEDFSWWVGRLRRTLTYVDVLRIDHFRGFSAYWEIPATEKTAVNGKWVEAPGQKLFKTIKKRLGELPIIAEDLGLVTPEVEALRDSFGFPGMKILQFAFGGDASNGFLPHNYHPNAVVYTGTHDNNTALGWFRHATDREKEFALRYLGLKNRTDYNINWELIRAGLQSVAVMSIFPFQDILGLGEEARFNFPGTIKDNWEWRFSWDQVGSNDASKLKELVALSGRISPEHLELPPYPERMQLP